MNYLLDTNIVSAIINKNERIVNKMAMLTDTGEQICISIITDYEINRGLFAANALKKLKIYNSLREQLTILWFNSLDISQKAAEIYAFLRKNGLPIQDADILIASTALISDLIVVSNDKHFLRIPDLKVENWLQ
ncbi:MAG: type II toxin-antitoxin system VapC family toxin [Thiomargarita sp.]|nr:type II toxin-antitoxin system VapC family toxin [Thiomargarita sp.]